MRPRLIPRDLGFYPLFAAQAEIAVQAASILEAGLRDLGDLQALSIRLQDLEHAGDDASHALTHMLETTFVLPFEREDMHVLTGALDDITDLIEKVGDGLALKGVTTTPPGADEQAAILVRSTRMVAEAMAALPRLSDLRAYPPRIHALEQEADRLRRRLVLDLYDDPTDAIAILIADDAYDGIEAAIDATDRVGRVLERMTLTAPSRW